MGLNKILKLPNYYQRFEDELEPIEEIQNIEQKLIENNKWIEKDEIEDYIENLNSNKCLQIGKQKYHSYEMIIQKWL